MKGCLMRVNELYRYNCLAILVYCYEYYAKLIKFLKKVNSLRLVVVFIDIFSCIAFDDVVGFRDAQFA